MPAPLYALPAVATAMNNGGGAMPGGALAFTGHSSTAPADFPQTGHHATAIEETINSARICLEPFPTPRAASS